MKQNKFLGLSLAIIFIFMMQSCNEDKSSFGEDLQVKQLPTEISYPDILNVREYSYIESAVPMMNSNFHPVVFELVNVKTEGAIVDASYLMNVSILNYSVIESNVRSANDSTHVWTVHTDDLSKMGQIIIEDDNKFANGEYFFTIKGKKFIDGVMETRIYEDVLRLVVGPELVGGIAYCPFKMNFVSGESTASGPAELFGGNPDVRFELGTEADKLAIDPVTGVISLNSSYSISDTEYVYPIINVISNISEEVVTFEGTFTAVLSTTPIELEKDNDYFFFPTLRTTAKQNVGLGGDGYSRVFVEHLGYVEGDPEVSTDWYITNAMWKSHKNNTKYIDPVETADAVAVREDAGVTGTTKLLMPWWTINDPSDSWIVMDPVNLALYEGCFDSKAVFWYKLYLNQYAGYELDGSTPIGLEVHITNNYTGDVDSTEWTQVNDILECEINDNGTIFTGTPYPGDQTGLNPDGLKDPEKNANNLWVRGELNLEDYKSESNFTIAFRVKTYFETTPYLPVNGKAEISNVHFVASEK